MTPKRTKTRTKKNKNHETIDKKLKKLGINKLAKKSGFTQRKTKKIKGRILIVSFVLMALQGKNTFEQWAEQIGILTRKTVSKQGIWKRVTVRLTNFLLAVLKETFKQQTIGICEQAKQHGALKKYKRILIQDSTTIALPAYLSWCFPGNVSKGKKKAQLKIQVIYDILNNQFIYFEVTPYTDNDQSKSKDILEIANEEDLVLRDLGYFALDCFDEMNQKKIPFLSRLKYGVTVFDAETEKEMDLLRTLKKCDGGLDRWVLVGKKQKVKVRLVAIPLSKEQTNLRRMKAKNDRDKRLNHKDDYYELLGYSLFITTEDQSVFSTTQIAQVYGFRWRIENIFKCWKGHFHLQKLIPQDRSITKERVEAIIYLMLIFVVLFQVTVYNYILMRANKIKDYLISLCKLCKYIANNITLFFEQSLNDIAPQILYHCRYDKRLDRKNFIQKLILS